MGVRGSALRTPERSTAVPGPKSGGTGSGAPAPVRAPTHACGRTHTHTSTAHTRKRTERRSPLPSASGRIRNAGRGRKQGRGEAAQGRQSLQQEDRGSTAQHRGRRQMNRAPAGAAPQPPRALAPPPPPRRRRALSRPQSTPVGASAPPAAGRPPSRRRTGTWARPCPRIAARILCVRPRRRSLGREGRGKVILSTILSGKGKGSVRVGS